MENRQKNLKELMNIMQKEKYKPIKNYENHYEISNLGNVRSLKNNKIDILIPNPNSNGYLRVKLYKEGIVRRVFIHHLVALHFKRNINKEIYVDHKNRIRTDNRAINLRWCDISTNLKNRKFIKKEKSNIKSQIMEEVPF